MKKNEQNEKPTDPKDLIKKNDVVLKSLVENALDFLDRSISDLKDHPKYSVINFHAAVELFLKARLIAEHWSLVLTNKNEPDLIKFYAGDFISVSMAEAHSKLKKAVCDGLTEEEFQSFDKVTKHRNRMVHFFSGAYTAHDKDALHQTIAKEQLIAWHFLNKILLDRWKDVFIPWKERIKAVEKKIRKHHEYLKVVFDKLQPEIASLKMSSFIFKICSSCGFESQKHQPILNEVYDSECMVCGFNKRALTLECPMCKKSVYFLGEGYSKCESCTKEFDPEYLVNALTDDYSAHQAAKNGDDSFPANCGECDSHEMVVELYDGNFFCCNCFETFEDLFMCDSCSELNTTDREQSYITGCNFCDGRYGGEN